jgi:alanine racemase
MPRPISAAISLAALTHNLDVVRQRLHVQAQDASIAPSMIWAVIKANAYGHGIETAVAAFSAAQGLAMLDINEAVRCREAGWVGPIMLLEGFFDSSDLDVLDRYHLTTVIHSRDQLDMLSRARLTRRLDAFLKLDSGMNRLGFTPESFGSAFERSQRLQEQGILGNVGKMTHFATADGPEGIDWQMRVFGRVTSHLPGPVSVCNSAATLRFPQAACSIGGRTSWVRPGICLYGSSPFNDSTAESFGLRPTMTLSSQIIGVQEVAAGETVGYGNAFRASVNMRIGVVACGYADGYPRHAPTGTPVTVAGIRTIVIGRVSMDMITVDLTAAPHAHVGTPVVLWGEGGPTVDEVARSAGTIGYELLCAVAPRVPVVPQQ